MATRAPDDSAGDGDAQRFVAALARDGALTADDLARWRLRWEARGARHRGDGFGQFLVRHGVLTAAQYVELLHAPPADAAASQTRPLSPPGPARVDRYVLGEELGRGGMAIVYAARDEQLGRDVAVKLIRPLQTDGGRLLERLAREAQALARIRHPGVVRLFEHGTHEDRPFLVMERVTGETLTEHVRRLGPLTPRDAAQVALAVAETVDAAHAAGVLHRDLKPGNVMREPTGGVRVLDFGLAALAEAEPLTATGAVLGTPHYMAPEQAAGTGTDARTDVYGIGALTYFALTGRTPVKGDGAAEVLAGIERGRVESLRAVRPDVSPQLAGIVMRCLELRPVDRPPDAAALAADLARFLEGAYVRDPRRAPGRRLARAWRRHRGRVVGLATLTLAVALGAVALWRRRATDERAAIEAVVARTTDDAERAAAGIAPTLDAARNALAADRAPVAATLLAAATRAHQDRSQRLLRGRLELGRLAAWTGAGRAARAAADGALAARLDADRADRTRLLLALLHAEQGDDAAARRARAHVATDPGLEALLDAALAGDEPTRATALERALRLAPDDPLVRRRHAALRQRQGRHAEARVDLEVCRRALPDSTAVLLDWARASLAEDRPGALPVLELALGRQRGWSGVAYDGIVALQRSRQTQHAGWYHVPDGWFLRLVPVQSGRTTLLIASGWSGFGISLRTWGLADVGATETLATALARRGGRLRELPGRTRWGQPTRELEVTYPGRRVRMIYGRQNGVPVEVQIVEPSSLPDGARRRIDRELPAVLRSLRTFPPAAARARDRRRAALQAADPATAAAAGLDAWILGERAADVELLDLLDRTLRATSRVDLLRHCLRRARPTDPAARSRLAALRARLGKE